MTADERAVMDAYAEQMRLVVLDLRADLDRALATLRLHQRALALHQQTITDLSDAVVRLCGVDPTASTEQEIQ